MIQGKEAQSLRLLGLIYLLTLLIFTIITCWLEITIQNNPLEIYDLRKLERVQSIEWKTEEGGKGGRVLGAMYSKPDADSIIACGSASNEFKIFDTSSEKVIASVTGVKRPIYSIDVADSNNLIAFGTSD